jgi:pimeloyl-ACP methyl ester carboxylesterase
MWTGYNAPKDIPEAMEDDYAVDAAALLHQFQRVLRITHTLGSPAHHTVIGHSYGTDVVGHTAATIGLDADDVIFVASPGAMVDHASMLKLTGHSDPTGRVWATVAPNDVILLALDATFVVDGRLPLPDVIPPQLVHGPNPAHPSFGAKLFYSEPEAGGIMKAHSAYWDDGKPSLRSMSLIISGRGVEVNLL